MHHTKFVLCSAAALLALAVGCSKSAQTPSAPTSVQDPGTGAAPDGSTLKVPAPTAVSPVNNAQPDTLTLTANRVSGKFDPSVNPSYEFEIRTPGGAAVAGCAGTAPPGSGNTVSFSPACSLTVDAAHTWRVRAVFAGAVGPWSSDATFRAPAGGYIRGNEVFDPLTNGRTAGEIFGPTQFIQGQGLKLLAHESHVTYRLPQNLQAGEFSMMILGADEGSVGDKSKVFAMQEGPDEGDITDDDYRMSAELRGNMYFQPGQVRYRFKVNELVEDGPPSVFNFNSSRWYFWRFTWEPGSGRLEIREDGPNGRQIYGAGVNMHGRIYRPDPHLVHIGAPVGRGCACDATLPGGIYKNVWVSSRPRPAFPGE